MARHSDTFHTRILKTMQAKNNNDDRDVSDQLNFMTSDVKDDLQRWSEKWLDSREGNGDENEGEFRFEGRVEARSILALFTDQTSESFLASQLLLH